MFHGSRLTTICLNDLTEIVNDRFLLILDGCSLLCFLFVLLSRLPLCLNKLAGLPLMSLWRWLVLKIIIVRTLLVSVIIILDYNPVTWWEIAFSQQDGVLLQKLLILIRLRCGFKWHHNRLSWLWLLTFNELSIKSWTLRFLTWC